MLKFYHLLQLAVVSRETHSRLNQVNLFQIYDYVEVPMPSYTTLYTGDSLGSDVSNRRSQD